MTDPIEGINPVEAKTRLDAARAAYAAAESAAQEATAAADAAGEPRFYGVTNQDLHEAERDAIDALLDATGEYEIALQTWKTLLDLHS